MSTPAPLALEERVISVEIRDIAGEPHRITTYSSNRIGLEPVAAYDPELALRIERRRRMMGNSRRKKGCGCGGA